MPANNSRFGVSNMSTDKQLEKEALAFFRNELGFHRLFLMMRKKYTSLGRIGGTVPLTGFSDDEKDSLGSFFGKDFNHMKSPIVSLKEFSEILTKTKFAALSFEKLLTLYFGEELKTNQEVREQAKKEKEAFFLTFINQFPEHKYWLKWIERNKSDSRFIHLQYEQNSRILQDEITKVCYALNHLPEPGRYERLPLFAQKTVKDPHGLDINRFTGRLFLHALQYKHYIVDSPDKGQNDIGDVSSTEAINDLLYSAGILRDDILNFVTCTGFLAETRGDIHKVFHYALETKMVLNLPLRELIKLDFIYPPKGKNVFIVENSSVFSEILDYFQEDSYPPLICTQGQFKLSALNLMDKLVEQGCQLFYTGDFDPEGLQMAQRLKERYKQNLNLSLFDKKYYDQTISDVVISDERLKKLESITIEELQPIKKQIEARKKAGYQEDLVMEIIVKIKRQSDFN